VITLAESGTIVASIPTWVDVAAAAVGALSGALISVRNKFDINGTLLLAIVTGLGGGIIRDLVLQQGIPVAFSSPLLLPTTLAVGTVVILLARRIDTITARLTRFMILVDAVFLGVYSVVGTAKGINADLPGVSCVLLGVLTGLGGGLLRDILVNEQPEVLRPGAVVAMTSVVGCSFYVATVAWLDLNNWALGFAAIGLIVGMRLIAVWRRWESPPTTELPSLRRLRPSPRRRPPSPPFPPPGEE
jgi:uncharacterized membrane protein YeiH